MWTTAGPGAFLANLTTASVEPVNTIVALWPSSAERSSAAAAAAAAIPDPIPDGNVAGRGSALVLAAARRRTRSGARVRGRLSSGEGCHCWWSCGGCRRACCSVWEPGADGADLSPCAAPGNGLPRGRRGRGEEVGAVGGALGGATSTGGGWRRPVLPGIARAGA